VKKISTLIVFLFAFTSCSHYYYIPPTQNIPLFTEKKEIRATASLGGGDEINTFDLQAAYAITNRFAVMSNFMHGNGGSSSDGGKGNYIDAGFGYYKPLEKHLIFEIYGGMGFCNQQHSYGESSGGTTISKGNADLSYTKIFLQNSVGVTTKILDIALTNRCSFIAFNKIKNRIDTLHFEYFYLDTIAKNKKSVLLEPSLTLRAGWKRIKLQVQFIYAANLSHPNLRFEDSKPSIGITYMFPERFGRKKHSKP
jgi:hypothetical protein